MPITNIFRDPRWGRGQEIYGEDPYLTLRMGCVVIEGLQGDKGSYKYCKAFVCVKHFAAHNGPEWNRRSVSIDDASPRGFHGTHLPAFKHLVQVGGVKGVVCVYNSADGKPCCSDQRLLEQLLRDERGFRGIVVSDCGVIDDIWHKGFHEVEPDTAHASVRVARGGIDTSCGQVYGPLPEVVRLGKVTEERTDKSLKCPIIGRMQLGEFDPDSVTRWDAISVKDVSTPVSREVVLKMAREAMTLLHNPMHASPLFKQLKQVVAMDPNASGLVMMWGNYNGTSHHTVAILGGIRRKIGTQRVKFIEGCGLIEPHRRGNQALAMQQLVEEMGDNRTAIFVGGIPPQSESEQLEVEAKGFEGGDRVTIELPQVQREMITALHAVGKQVITANRNDNAIGLVPGVTHTNAILQIQHPGERGGEAMADMLFGDYNPAGKLPVMSYWGDSQLSNYLDYSMRNRIYRYSKGKPLFPFGYGLSYMSFKIGKARMRSGKLTVGAKNMGKRDGEEVVQLYISYLGGPNGPAKSSGGFKRMALQADEQYTVTLNLPRKSFERFDEQTNTIRMVPDKYKAYYGTSSDEVGLQSFIYHLQ